MNLRHGIAVAATASLLAAFPLMEGQRTPGQAEPRYYEATGPASTLPMAGPAPPRGRNRTVYAYNSVPEQTDSTPCIAADGTDICRRAAAGERICAANWAPIGTRLRIPGWGTCTVADRMNARYPSRVDIFLDKDIPAAIRWGARRIRVEVIP